MVHEARKIYKFSCLKYLLDAADGKTLPSHARCWGPLYPIPPLLYNWCWRAQQKNRISGYIKFLIQLENKMWAGASLSFSIWRNPCHEWPNIQNSKIMWLKHIHSSRALSEQASGKAFIKQGKSSHNKSKPWICLTQDNDNVWEKITDRSPNTTGPGLE